MGEDGTVRFQPSPFLIHKQLTLMGTWVCGLVEMESLLEILVRKGLHPEATLTHRFPLADAHEAYRTFASGTPGKVALTWP